MFHSWLAASAFLSTSPRVTMLGRPRPSPAINDQRMTASRVSRKAGVVPCRPAGTASSLVARPRRVPICLQVAWRWQRWGLATLSAPVKGVASAAPHSPRTTPFVRFERSSGARLPGELRLKGPSGLYGAVAVKARGK